MAKALHASPPPDGWRGLHPDSPCNRAERRSRALLSVLPPVPPTSRTTSVVYLANGGEPPEVPVFASPVRATESSRDVGHRPHRSQGRPLVFMLDRRIDRASVLSRPRRPWTRLSPGTSDSRGEAEDGVHAMSRRREHRGTGGGSGPGGDHVVDEHDRRAAWRCRTGTKDDAPGEIDGSGGRVEPDGITGARGELESGRQTCGNASDREGFRGDGEGRGDVIAPAPAEGTSPRRRWNEPEERAATRLRGVRLSRTASRHDRWGTWPGNATRTAD